MGRHLQEISDTNDEGRKQLIWAGDLNVNPTRADWSTRAFDRIRHKIPRDVKPAGCREEDQERYREMIREMDGVNVAERFNKESQRTCFPTLYTSKPTFQPLVTSTVGDLTPDAVSILDWIMGNSESVLYTSAPLTTKPT